MVYIEQKKIKIDSVLEGSVVTCGIDIERAIVLNTGAMGTRVDVTANYAKYRINRRGQKILVTDGFTLGHQVWSAGTMVYIVEE